MCPSFQINEEAQEFTVTEPKKIKAVGLLDFPYDAMLKVLQAGIKPASLSITYCLADATQHKTVALCQKNGIKVRLNCNTANVKLQHWKRPSVFVCWDLCT